MVSIPVCHTGDRGSIPRQRELLELNTRIHPLAKPGFDLQNLTHAFINSGSILLIQTNEARRKNLADDRTKTQTEKIFTLNSRLV